jgi:hypothetical protein
MANFELMQSIKTKWNAEIASACSTSATSSSVPSPGIPAAFVAALIANESGGDPNAKRFEKGVLASLWEVLLGRKAAFGSIATKDLIQFVANLSNIPPVTPQSLPSDAFQRLDSLATSWGLTQIMGYEAIAFRSTVAALQAPDTELVITLKMLAQFASRFGLDVTKDFSQLFDCWNSGRPHAPTADPQYIPNGLERMQLWTSI